MKTQSARGRVVDPGTDDIAGRLRRGAAADRTDMGRPIPVPADDAAEYQKPVADGSWLITPPHGGRLSGDELEAAVSAAEPVRSRGGRELVVCVCCGGDSLDAATRAAAEQSALAYLDDLRSQARLAAPAFAWNALELRAVVHHLGTETFFEYDPFLRRFVPMPRHAGERIM